MNMTDERNDYILDCIMENKEGELNEFFLKFRHLVDH